MVIELSRIQKFLLFEGLFFFCFFALIILLQAIFTFFEEKRKKDIKKIQELVSNMMIDSPQEACAPQPLRTLLHALLEVNGYFCGSTWEDVKKRLLEPHKSTFLHIGFFFRKKKFLQALNAAHLCPSLFSGKELTALIHKTPHEYQSEVIDIICMNPEKEFLILLLDKLASDVGYGKHLVRDALIASSNTVYALLLEIYRTEPLQYRKAACLEVLSQKIGYLTFEDVRPCLQGNNIHLLWWGLRALENIPCDEAVSTLIHYSESQYTDIRAIVASNLGHFPLDTVRVSLEQLIHDPHWLVRLYAGLSIRRFGSAGTSILDAIASEATSDAQATARYILSLKSQVNPRMLIKWLDARAMR